MNPDLVKKISLFAESYKTIKVENALAIVDYISGGVGFHHPKDPEVWNELGKASHAVGIPIDWIVKAFERWREDGFIPTLRFNQALWEMERRSSNGDITDMLMSFEYGLTLERMRPIITAADKLPFSNLWGGLVKAFASSEDAQVVFLLNKMTAVQSTLGRGDNFLVAYSGLIRGEKHKVVSPTPEAVALASIAARYRRAKEDEYKRQRELVLGHEAGAETPKAKTNASVLRGASGELN